MRELLLERCTLLTCGAGGHASILVLPDPRVAHGVQALRRSQAVVFCSLKHVLLHTHTVVKAPGQIVLSIGVTLQFS